MGLDFLSVIGGLGKGAALISDDQHRQAAERRADEVVQIQKDEAGRRKAEYDRRSSYLSDIGDIVARHGQRFAEPEPATTTAVPEAGSTPSVKAGGAPPVEAAGAPSVEAGGTPSVKAGGAPSVEAGGAPSVEAGGTPSVEAGAGQVAAADSVSFSSPSSSPVTPPAVPTGTAPTSVNPASGNPFSGLSSFYGKMSAGQRAQMQSEMLASAVKHGQIELPHYQQAMQHLDALHKTGTLDALNLALQGGDMAAVEKALAESGVRIKPGSLKMQPVAKGAYDLPDTVFSVIGEDGQQRTLSLNTVSAAALSSKDRFEFLVKQQQTRALGEYRHAKTGQAGAAPVIRQGAGGAGGAGAGGGSDTGGNEAGVKQENFFKDFAGEGGKVNPDAPYGWKIYQRLRVAASPEQRRSGAFDATAQRVAKEVAQGQRNISAELMPNGSWAEVVKMPNGQQMVLEDSRTNGGEVDPLTVLNRNGVPVLLEKSADKKFHATPENKDQLASDALQVKVGKEREVLLGYRQTDPAGYALFEQTAASNPHYDALREKALAGKATPQERMILNYASMIRNVETYKADRKTSHATEPGKSKRNPADGGNYAPNVEFTQLTPW